MLVGDVVGALVDVVVDGGFVVDVATGSGTVVEVVEVVVVVVVDVVVVV